MVINTQQPNHNKYTYMSENACQNTGRQREVDFIKAIAIVGMVFIHCYERFLRMEEYVEPTITATPEGVVSGIIEFICTTPGPALFMFCLGIGIIYSRRKTAGYLFSRAWLMLLFAFILEFFRSTLPYTIGAITLNDPSIFSEVLMSFLQCDILNFAFLTFLFFALVKKFSIPNAVVIAIPVVLLIISSFIPDLVSDNDIVNSLVGWIFWQDTGYSFFPITQWLIYPALGYVFGQFLIKTEDKKAHYKRVIVVSGIGFVLLPVAYLLAGVDVVSLFTLYHGNYYDQNVLSVPWMTLAIGVVISLIYFMTRKLKETNVVNRCATWFSKNITSFYCIQWVTISWMFTISYIAGLLPVSYPMVVVLAVVVLIFCSLVVKIYNSKIKVGRKKSQTS